MEKEFSLEASRREYLSSGSCCALFLSHSLPVKCPRTQCGKPRAVLLHMGDKGYDCLQCFRLDMGLFPQPYPHFSERIDFISKYLYWRLMLWEKSGSSVWLLEKIPDCWVCKHCGCLCDVRPALLLVSITVLWPSYCYSVVESVTHRADQRSRDLVVPVHFYRLWLLFFWVIHFWFNVSLF